MSYSNSQKRILNSFRNNYTGETKETLPKDVSTNRDLRTLEEKGDVVSYNVLDKEVYFRTDQGNNVSRHS